MNHAAELIAYPQSSVYDGRRFFTADGLVDVSYWNERTPVDIYRQESSDPRRNPWVVTVRETPTGQIVDRARFCSLNAVRRFVADRAAAIMAETLPAAWGSR